MPILTNPEKSPASRPDGEPTWVRVECGTATIDVSEHGRDQSIYIKIKPGMQFVCVSQYFDEVIIELAADE